MKRNKLAISVTAITLVVIIVVAFAVAGEQITGELFNLGVKIQSSIKTLIYGEVVRNDNIIDDMPTINLNFDIQYYPLPNINSDKIIEKQLGENQTVHDDVVFDKAVAEKILAEAENYILTTDDKGNYIIAYGLHDSAGYGDICIAVFDAVGNKINKKRYAGSDYESAYSIKFNPQMGIVISGTSQSSDGDFAFTKNIPYGNTPFVACIDAESLEVKWMYPVQGAGETVAVADDAVFVISNEGAPYSGGALNLSVVKLDKDGKKVWQTEPLDQWIHRVRELKDGRIVVIQQVMNDQGNSTDGFITFYNKDGERLYTIKTDCSGDITPTNDGGFISVSFRNVKTIPLPVYVSSIWYDSETVVTKYSTDCEIEWRKTYDTIKDAVGRDVVVPQADGSVIVAGEL